MYIYIDIYVGCQIDEHEESTFDTTIHVTICIYVDLYIFISYVHAEKYFHNIYLDTSN